LLLIAVLLLRPQGLLPEERRVSIWVERLIRRHPLPRREEAPAASRTE
jgi:hypothetical protein